VLTKAKKEQNPILIGEERPWDAGQIAVVIRAAQRPNDYKGLVQDNCKAISLIDGGRRC